MIHDMSLPNMAKRQWLRVLVLTIISVPVSALAQTAPESPVEPTPVTPQPTLEHQPAQLPSVTFKDGQLTITAYNSTLHDVLEMVRKQTGAMIDIPPEATERVFVNLGPGPARRILDQLLTGSSLNYVLLGSSADPQALTKVVLTAKPSGTDNEVAPALAAAAAQHRPGRRQASVPEDADTTAAPIQESGETSSSEETAANPPGKAAKPEAQDKTDAATAADPGGEQPGNAASTEAANAQAQDFPHTPNIRTAQQVLQDLYARRQAMQQQQNQQTKQQ